MNSSSNPVWSKDPKVALNEPYKDARGIIQSLISLPTAKIRSAVWIESNKDSIRANHYHKTDWHYCYIVSGSIIYHHRPVNSDEKPIKILINSGEIFYTPPMIEHAMEFPEDTVFLTLSGGSRSEEDYETDLVRVNLI